MTKISGKDIQNRTVGSDQIAHGAVSSSHMQRGSVGAGTIAPRSIDEQHLSPALTNRVLPAKSDSTRDWRAALENSPSPPSGTNPFVTLRDIQLQTNYWGEPTRGEPRAFGSEPKGTVKLDSNSGVPYYFDGSAYSPLSFSHASAIDLESDSDHRHLTEKELLSVKGLDGIRESGAFKKLSPLRARSWSSVSGALSSSVSKSGFFALDSQWAEPQFSIDDSLSTSSGHSLVRKLVAGDLASVDANSDGIFDRPFRETAMPQTVSASFAPIRGSSGVVDSGLAETPKSDKIFLGEGVEKSDGYVHLSKLSAVVKNSLDYDRLGSGGFREGNLLARGAFVASSCGGESALPQIVDLAFPDKLSDEWIAWIADSTLSPSGFQVPTRNAPLTTARVTRDGIELAPSDRWEEETVLTTDASLAEKNWVFSDGPERSWVVFLSGSFVSVVLIPTSGDQRAVSLRTLAGSSSGGNRLESTQWESMDVALVRSVPGTGEAFEIRFVFLGVSESGDVGFYASGPIDPIAPFTSSELSVNDCTLELRLAFEQLAGRDLTDVQDVSVVDCGRQRRNVSGGPVHAGFAFTSRSKLYAGAFDWVTSGSTIEPYFAVVQVVDSVDRFAVEGLDDNGMIVAAELLPKRGISVCVLEFGGVRSTLSIQGPTWEGSLVKPRQEISAFFLATDQPRRALSDAAADSVLEMGRFTHLLVLTRDGIVRDVVWCVSTSGGSPSSPPTFTRLRDSDVFAGVSSIEAVSGGPQSRVVFTSIDGSQSCSRTIWRTRQDPIVSPLKTVGSALEPLSGTVSVTEGSTTVTGSGTSFSTQVSLGDEISAGGALLRVARVTSDTSLDSESAHPGPNASSLTAYSLDRNASSWDSERQWPAGSRCLSLSVPHVDFVTDPTVSPPYPTVKAVGNGSSGVKALALVDSTTGGYASAVFKTKEVGATAASASFLTADAPSDLDSTAWYGAAGALIRKHGTDAPAVLLIGGSDLDAPTYTSRDSINWLALDDAVGSDVVESLEHYPITSAIGGLPIAASHASVAVAGANEDGYFAFVFGGLTRGRPYGEPEPCHYVQRLVVRQSPDSPPTGSDVSFHLDAAESKFVYPTVSGGYGTSAFLHYVTGAWKLCLVSGNGDLYEGNVDLELVPGPGGTVTPADSTAFSSAFSPVKVDVESTHDGIAIPSSVLGGVTVAQWNNSTDRGLVADPRAFAGPDEQPSKTWVVYLENESDLSYVAVKVLRVDENQEPRRRWFSAALHLQENSYRPAARLEAQIRPIGWKEAPDDEAVSKAAVFVVHGGSVYCQGVPSKDRCPGKETWLLEIWEAQLSGDLEIRCRWAKVDSGFGVSDPGPVIGAASASIPKRLDTGAATEPISYLCWGGSSHTVYAKGHPGHAWVWRWPTELGEAQLDLRSAAQRLSGPYLPGTPSLVVLGPIDVPEWGDLRARVRAVVPTGTSVTWALSTQPASDSWFRYDSSDDTWKTTTAGGASGLKLQHVHGIEDVLLNAWTSPDFRRDLTGASQLWIAVSVKTVEPYLTPIVRGFDFEFRTANENVVKHVSASDVEVWSTVSGRSTLAHETLGSEVFVRLSSLASRVT